MDDALGEDTVSVACFSFFRATVSNGTSQRFRVVYGVGFGNREIYR